MRATEAYTARLPGHRRNCAPIYSLMVATEPLDGEQWEAIGLRERETFGDLRHLIIYGQRTADGRIAFGGRGAPYHFGSRVSPGYDRVPTVFAALRESLRELLAGAARRPVHPRVGRPARGAARLVRLRSDSTATPGWAGPAVTSATASPRPTWPGALSPT